VIQDSTQVFRTHLTDLHKRKGISDEKGVFMMIMVLLILTCVDPEEFLNFLFKHILNLNPFVRIR